MADTAKGSAGWIGIVVGGIFLFGMVAHGCDNGSSTSSSSTSTSSAPSEQEIESGVIDICQQGVKKQLKDPDSAKFADDWKAWVVTHYDKPPPVSYHPENGDKYYNAGGSVNAKNSFGGYVGDQMYGCDAAVTRSGEVSAHVYSVDDILNQPTN